MTLIRKYEIIFGLCVEVLIIIRDLIYYHCAVKYRVKLSQFLNSVTLLFIESYLQCCFYEAKKSKLTKELYEKKYSHLLGKFGFCNLKS